MNIVRKPDSSRSPALQRSANTIVPGSWNRCFGVGHGSAVLLPGAGCRPRPGAGSPGSCRRRTPGTRSAATTRAPNVRRARPPAAPETAAPAMPASEIRELALTRLRSARQQPRARRPPGSTPYALDATRQPSAAGNSAREPAATAPASTQQRNARSAIVRADRPAAAVAEPVEERPDQRRDDREREHGQAEEQRDLAAGLAGGHLEEERAGQRDRDRRVAGGVERVQLDQPEQPAVAGALGVAWPGGPGGAWSRRRAARAPGRGDAPAGRPERAATPPRAVSSSGPDASGWPRSGAGRRGVHGTILPSRPAPCRSHPPCPGAVRNDRALDETPRRDQHADHQARPGRNSLAGADPIAGPGRRRGARGARRAGGRRESVGDPRLRERGQHVVTQYFDCTRPATAAGAGRSPWRTPSGSKG